MFYSKMQDSSTTIKKHVLVSLFVLMNMPGKWRWNSSFGYWCRHWFAWMLRIVMECWWNDLIYIICTTYHSIVGIILYTHDVCIDIVGCCPLVWFVWGFVIVGHQYAVWIVDVVLLLGVSHYCFFWYLLIICVVVVVVVVAVVVVVVVVALWRCITYFHSSLRS